MSRKIFKSEKNLIAEARIAAPMSRKGSETLRQAQGRLWGTLT
jgi:hypothetical protein